MLATPEGVDRAFRKLDELKPNLIWWTAGAQPPQMLAAGDVAMTTAYNGRIAAANNADKKDFKIVWTGSLFTIDSWVILKGSPNVDAATKFLAYMGKPENQAKLPTKITYGVTNKAATPLIAAEYLPGLPTNPANMSQAVRAERRVLAGEHRQPDRALQHLGGEVGGMAPKLRGGRSFCPPPPLAGGGRGRGSAPQVHSIRSGLFSSIDSPLPPPPSRRGRGRIEPW